MSRSKVIVFLLGILTLVAVGFVLKYAQGVILPLIIAWLLSYIVGPVVNLMTRHRIPMPLAVTLLVVLLLAGFYLGGVFLFARISAFVAVYPKYQEQLSDLALNLASRSELVTQSVLEIPWAEKLGAFLGSAAGSLVNFVSNLIMVIIFLVFILLGRPYGEEKIRKAFSPERAEKAIAVLNNTATQIGRYLSVQFLISLATGMMVWAVLAWIGVDFAITLGAMAFLLNFIPTLGSIVASIPPILLALVQFYPNPWPCIITAVALLGIQMTLGNVISPKVMGDRLNLSPVVVLLSLVFWGWLWGVIGALLSVPIASAIKIVCENIEPLRPISILMGSGRQYRG
jgi:AI-2 transport protein TqsA